MASATRYGATKEFGFPTAGLTNVILSRKAKLQVEMCGEHGPLPSFTITSFGNPGHLQGQNAQPGSSSGGHHVTVIICKYLLMLLTEQKVYEAEDVFF